MRNYCVIIVWIAVVSSIFGIVTPTIVAQTPKAISLIIIPERVQVSSDQSSLIIVLVENRTNQLLQDVEFTLLPNQRLLMAVDILPTTILSQTSTTASYAIMLEEEGNYTLFGKLSYTIAGQQQITTTQTTITVSPRSSTSGEVGFILFGAVLGIAGGAIGEIIKGAFERRKQGSKALSILLPTLAASAYAVKENRSTPQEFWQDVYFKEGLHSALLERAKTREQVTAIQDLPRLYAQLTDYTNHPTLINRKDLYEKINHVYTILEQLV